MNIKHRVFTCLGSLIAISGAVSVVAQDSVLSVLSPNECGLFVWVGPEEELRFLAKKDGAVVFARGENPEKLRAINVGALDKYDLSKRQTLQDGLGLEYELRLENPIPTQISVVYRQGTLTLPSPDGWLQIENAIGMSTCNPARTAFDVLGGENLDRLSLPDWVSKPNFDSLRQVDETPEVIASPESPMRAPPASDTPYAQTAAVQPEIISKTDPLIIPEPVIWRRDEGITKIDIPTLIAAETDNAELAATDFIEPVVIAEPVPLYEVQLGAFDEPLKPIEAWEEISARAPYISDQSYRIAAATIKPNQIVYRLRMTGFSTFSTAAKYCEKLKLDDVDCYAAKAE